MVAQACSVENRWTAYFLCISQGSGGMELNICWLPCSNRPSPFAVLAAGCVAMMLPRSATAFMHAGKARLFATGLRGAASGRAAPLRQWRTQVAGGSLSRKQRMAPLSSGIPNVKMVATDIFSDVKKAKIMEKFDFVKEDTIEEYGAQA